MTSRSSVARASALVVIAGVLLSPSSSVAAEPTCHDVPATIVVTEDGPKTGTEGADVIVIEGADNRWVFDAKGGDDLICVTSPHGVSLFYAGDGDDTVDASAAKQWVSVDLGRGADQYVGHIGPDSVATDYGDAADNKVDTVRTGPGEDSVHSGTPRQPNSDDIELGAGNDDLLIEGVPGGVFSAGNGRDSLEVWEAGRRAWAFDVGVDPDVVTVDDQPSGIDGFESYDLTLLDWARLSYLGGPGNDRVDTLSNLHDLGEEAPRHRGPMTARLGAGSDRITVDGDHRGTIRAGSGRDRLLVKQRCSQCRSSVTASLLTGEMRLNGRADSPVLDFEDLELEAFGRVDVIATPRHNTVRVHGCSAVVYGAGGADRIKLYGEFECPTKAPQALSAYGGAGDDDLEASPWSEHRGTGKAYGGPGHDRCAATIAIGCERIVH